MNEEIVMKWCEMVKQGEHVSLILLQENTGLERKKVGQEMDGTASEFSIFVKGRSAGGQLSTSRQVTDS